MNRTAWTWSFALGLPLLVAGGAQLLLGPSSGGASGEDRPRPPYPTHTLAHGGVSEAAADDDAESDFARDEDDAGLAEDDGPVLPCHEGEDDESTLDCAVFCRAMIGSGCKHAPSKLDCQLDCQDARELCPTIVNRLIRCMDALHLTWRCDAEGEPDLDPRCAAELTCFDQCLSNLLDD